MLRKEEDKPIIAQIKTNTKKFIEIFYQIAENNLPLRNKEINPEDVLIVLSSNLDTIFRMLFRNKGHKI
jgi:hypothetical protein